MTTPFDVSLTARERDRLAVLRTIALAHADAEKVQVWRVDMLALLDAVDRLAAAPRVESLSLFQGPIKARFLAGAMTVHQGRRGTRGRQW